MAPSVSLQVKAVKVMPDEACRLAKVEERVDGVDAKLDAIIKSIEDMKTEQTKYKGFIGGVVFAVGALFSFLTWWTGNR